MSEEKDNFIKNCSCKTQKKNSGMVGCVYFLGFIGALVYYIQQANTFQMGLVGVLKALTWPAFLIYRLLGFLQM